LGWSFLAGRPPTTTFVPAFGSAGFSVARGEAATFSLSVCDDLVIVFPLDELYHAVGNFVVNAKFGGQRVDLLKRGAIGIPML
jgi:hypothetical protein